MPNSYTNYIGIDIGKFEFVAALNSDSQIKTYTVDKKGFKTFFSDFKQELPNSLVVLEATGGYEHELLNHLIDNGIAVHKADTRKVKSFIRSFGIHGKTDFIDALALAKYGLQRADELSVYEPLSPEQQQLRLLVERRQDLVEMMVKEKNRHQAPLNKSLQKHIIKHISFLEKEISEINRQMSELTESVPELKEKARIAQEIPGIGEVTATSLIAYLPELGRINRRQIASLAGVAPHPRESGTKQWQRRTVGGRRNLRPILFMSAMSASRSKSPLGAFYNSLIMAGKKPIVAQVALMRKILVIMNAKVRDHLAAKGATMSF